MIGISRSIDGAAVDVQGVNGLATEPTKAVINAIGDGAAGVHIQHTANRSDSCATGIAQLQCSVTHGGATAIGVCIRELDAARAILNKGTRATDHTT